MWIAVGALWLALPTWAEPSEPAEEVDALRSELETRAVELEALASELEALTAQRDAQSQEAQGAAQQAEVLASLLDLGAILLDDRRSDDDRAQAAEALAATGDLRVLPLLRAGARDWRPAVQRASVRASSAFVHPETAAIARAVLIGFPASPEVMSAAVGVLAGLGLEQAGDVLWEVVGRSEVPGQIRREALEALRAHYPQVVARLGEPRTLSDPLGAIAGVAANSAVGGILLGSVGAWGRFEAGPTLGAVGGSLVGAGTGTLVVTSRPVTSGQGLAYASGVGWGWTAGILGGKSVLGANRWATSTATGQANRDIVEPMFWSIGTAAGAGVGLWTASRSPDPWNVVEVDVTTYLGSALSLAAVDLVAFPAPYVSEFCDPFTDPTCDPGAYDDWMWRTSRVRSGLTLAGAAAGLGVGLALNPAWELDPADGVFAGVVGAEAAWIGNFAPIALGLDDPSGLRGTIRLPLHAAVAGALVVSELHPIRYRQSITGLYGAGVGNALGAGVALLAAPRDDGQLTAQLMVPLGIGGMVGGLAGDAWLDPGGGEWTAVSIGVPIASAQAAAVGAYLSSRGVALTAGTQVTGLALTTGAAAGAGLIVLGHYTDPKPADVVFVGSTALWGAWYGTLLPVAFDLGWQSESVAFSGAMVSDGFMLAGAYLLTPRVGLRPGQTVVAQIGGLSGATAGALGVALFSSESDDVAMGAVVGSALGLGAGALVTGLRSASGRSTARLRLPQTSLRVPGRWKPQALPTVMNDGSMGVHLGLTVDDW